MRDFKVRSVQYLQFHNWNKEHKAEKHPSGYEGAIGGRLTWEFTPTSLGIITKVRCSCGEQIDLTDYESW